MADNKKIFRLSKRAILSALIISALFFIALFLHNRIAKLTEDNRKNLSELNQVLPNFSNQAMKVLQQDIDQLEAQLLSFTYLFDPPDKQIKKDYDLPIYFVEELGKVKQSLKMKSADRKVTYPDFGFKETLPDEKEAKYLLKQLCLIREVVNTGMEDGVNFAQVTPLPVEDLGVSTCLKSAKVRLDFTASGHALIDFLIDISDIVPLNSVGSILVKLENSVYKSSLTLSYISIEADWKSRAVSFAPLNVKQIFAEQDKNISFLRANNPFSLVKGQEQTGQPSKASEQPKQAPRFLYQGKAVLKGKEVAVIVDALTQETIFLAPDEKTGDFVLKELKDLQITLKNTNTGQEIVVKRQEQ